MGKGTTSGRERQTRYGLRYMWNLIQTKKIQTHRKRDRAWAEGGQGKGGPEGRRSKGTNSPSRGKEVLEMRSTTRLYRPCPVRDRKAAERESSAFSSRGECFLFFLLCLHETMGVSWTYGGNRSSVHGNPTIMQSALKLYRDGRRLFLNKLGKNYRQALITAVFTITRNWNESRCLPAGDMGTSTRWNTTQRNKLYIHTTARVNIKKKLMKLMPNKSGQTSENI